MEQPQSLLDAKQLLRDLELRKDGKNEMIGEYKQVLNIVVDAISKLTADDDESETSLTLPETIVSDNSSFFLCGGGGASVKSTLSEKSYGWIEEQHEGEPLHWRRDLGKEEEQRDEAEIDDEVSIASDVIPLYMTDEDALDEIDFTRELMGYVEGFEATEMPISRIEEEEFEVEFEPYFPSTPIMKSTQRSTPGSSPKPQRPPLPRKAQAQTPPSRKKNSLIPSRQPQQRQAPPQPRSPHPGTRAAVQREVPKKRFGHRRHRSGGSVPDTGDVPKKADPPGLLRRRLSGQISLPDVERRRRSVACASCKRKIYEGDVCDCGKWEI